MTPRRRLDKIEWKLTRLLAVECDTCSRRVGRCPECGHPLGPTAAEGERLRQVLTP